MTRAWAPNGRDVVDWPAGEGLTIAPFDEDAYEARKIVGQRSGATEGSSIGRARAIASKRAKAARKRAYLGITLAATLLISACDPLPASHVTLVGCTAFVSLQGVQAAKIDLRRMDTIKVAYATGGVSKYLVSATGAPAPVEIFLTASGFKAFINAWKECGVRP